MKRGSHDTKTRIPVEHCQRNGCSSSVKYQLVFDAAKDYWFCWFHAHEWKSMAAVTLVNVT